MRHANLRVVAFGAVLAVSFSALAQQAKDAGAPKTGAVDAGKAATTAAASAGAATPASSARPAASGGATPTGGVTTAGGGDGGTAPMAAASSSAAPAGMDGPTYAVRLRD